MPSIDPESISSGRSRAVNKFKDRARGSLRHILALLLLILAVTIVYLFSVGTDLLVLFFINLSTGDAINQLTDLKKFLNLTTFDLFKLISSAVTVGGYALTLGFLLFKYISEFLRLSWEPRRNAQENLTSEMWNWLGDTGTSLVVIGTGTAICILLIGTIALVLWVVDFAISDAFVNIVKLLTTLAISIVYFYTIGYSLYKFARDLLKMSFGSSTPGSNAQGGNN